MATALFQNSLASARSDPGIRGRFHLATDTGDLSVDDGTEWRVLQTGTSVSLIKEFLPGNLAAETFSNFAVPWDSVRIKRLQARCHTLPSGATGTDHYTIRLTDGTTNVDVDVDSDVQVHEDDITQQVERVKRVNNSAGTILSDNYVWNSFAVTSEVTVNRLTMLAKDSCTADYTPYILDSGQSIIGQGSAVNKSVGNGTLVGLDLNADVTLSPGNQYFAGILASNKTSGFIRWEYTSSGSYTDTNIATWYGGRTNQGPGSISLTASNVHRFWLYEVTYPELTASNNDLTLEIVSNGTPPGTPGGDVMVTIELERI